MKKVLLFQVGTIPFGIDLPRVKSIQSVKTIFDERTEDSNQPRRVFDDEKIPLYDLVSVLGGKTVNRDLENEKLIMVKTEGQLMRMIVSRVDQVIFTNNDKIEPLSPIFTGASKSCFPHVLKHDDALILILAPEGLEKAVQQTADAQNVTSTSSCGDALPDEEELVILVNEVPTISDQVSMSPINHCAQESNIYESPLTEDNPEVRRSSEDMAVAGTNSEIVDMVDIDDESKLESTSFLTNLLQNDSGDSSQAKPTGSN